jgi:hypothetical protein
VLPYFDEPISDEVVSHSSAWAVVRQLANAAAVSAFFQDSPTAATFIVFLIKPVFRKRPWIRSERYSTSAISRGHPSLFNKKAGANPAFS